VTSVLELLLLDRTGNSSTDRTTFQDLTIRDLVNTDIPKTPWD
jgi:hypothetical protein